jgi:DNA-binding NtrC family response regulator
MGYSWPGNVRELENAIEHAIVLGLTEEILPEDLPEGMLENNPPRCRERDTMRPSTRRERD